MDGLAQDRPTPPPASSAKPSKSTAKAAKRTSKAGESFGGAAAAVSIPSPASVLAALSSLAPLPFTSTVYGRERPEDRGAAAAGTSAAAVKENGDAAAHGEASRDSDKAAGCAQLTQKLSMLGLPAEYAGVLRHAGCETAEDLEYLVEKDLMSMGIKRVYARRILYTANPPQPGAPPKPDRTAQALAGLAWRLMDAGEEPLRALPPIETPPPGLPQGVEDAVSPLDSLYPQACRYARHAHFALRLVSEKHDVNGLEVNEATALRLYLTDFSMGTSIFVLLNAALRSPDRSQITPYLGLLQLLLSGVGKLPPVGKMMVYRGTRRRYEELNLPPAGQMFTWWGFASCLESFDVLQDVCGEHADRTIFAITTVSGVRVRDYATSTSEEEVLLRPGTQLEVRSVLRLAGGTSIVFADELPHAAPLFRHRQLPDKAEDKAAGLK